ncbi:MAG TPA: pyridoxamine 5'-phosphate oxidase family protein [Candidatus Aphodovivens avistercoris]|nr:pyridoxamine 5'-phosphate oxidase family protein [Candidatus Aphodovivens avistercoris]
MTDRTDSLETIVGYLTSVPAWYLATCEGDQPHVRPFSFAALEDGRIWFCTATTKDVYRELTANPKFELTAWKPGSGWIIVRGKADLADGASAEVRQAGFEHMIALGEHHDGPNAPELTFFSMTDAAAWLCDIDGSWNPLPL